MSSAARDKSLRVFDLQEAECIGRLKGHSAEVTSVSIFGSSKQVGETADLESVMDEDDASSHGSDSKGPIMMALTTSKDKNAKIWRLDTKKCVRSLPPPKGDPLRHQKLGRLPRPNEVRIV